MSEEIWKPIKGYEGLYEVSNMGRVRSLDRFVRTRNNKLRLSKGKMLSFGDNGHGYKIVNLSKNNNPALKYVHRLVASAFVENLLDLPEVNHKDENLENNCVDNLEWCTAKYNANYGTRNERNRKEKIENYGKKVNQYDLYGNFIRTFPSLSVIEEKYGFFATAISRCCKGKQKTSYGYIWKFADE